MKQCEMDLQQICNKIVHIYSGFRFFLLILQRERKNDEI